MKFSQICSFLIMLIIVNQTNSVFCQENGFDLARIKEIKEYNSAQLENGLTIIQINSKDSGNCFLRAYTNLPEYVAKSYRSLIEIENQLRKTPEFILPGGWQQKMLDEKNIKLGKDENGFIAHLPDSNLELALNFISDLFQKPTVSADQVEKSKQIILYKSDSLLKLPGDRIDKITKSIIYGKDHPILKYLSQEEINPITFQNYLEFREKFYKPNNSYVVVIGNISLDSIKVLASKSFALWKKKDVPSSDYKLIPIEEPKIVFFDTVPSGQSMIKILFPFALYPFNFDAEKAELLSLIFQDVLTDKLIEDKQLASGIEAKFESDKITGNYQLQVKLTKDSLNLVIETIIETIAGLKSGIVPEEKLNIAKKKIINDFKNNTTDNAFISWLIINTERNSLSKEFYSDFIQEIEKTSSEGMKTFAAKYLNYSTSLFQIPGNWYNSLNDFIKLSANFRIELYDLDGNIKKVIPRGFNGFSVINNYVEAVGGEKNIRKTKEVSIRYGAIYELPNEEKMYVDGVMVHKSDDKYFSESRMIRPKQDTLLVLIEVFDGTIGMDSTMQGKKMLAGLDLELLKYKSPLVPEIKYKEWQYKANLVEADTLNGKYVWVVLLENQAKQKLVDYYDVDEGIRYKREIKDDRYFNERIIQYSKYQRDNADGILYPYLKVIIAPETTMHMLIREVDYNTKNKKEMFEVK